MKLSLLVVTVLLTITTAQGASGRSRINSYEDYQGSWSVAIGASFGSRVARHNETSTDNGFVSIKEDIRIKDQGFSLSVMKEFLNQQQYSLTVKFVGGINTGEYESQYDVGVADSKNQSKFIEELSGAHFGAGLSLNYNTFLYGFKLQPYLGVDFIQDQGKMVLTHNNSTTVTTHKYSDQVALISLGFRAYDSEVGLMSYFIASMPQALSENLTVSTVINNFESAGKMVAGEYLRAPLQLSIGFGFFF